MSYRLRLPRRSTIAALMAAVAALIAATAIAPNPAAAGGVAPGTLGSPTAPTSSSGQFRYIDAWNYSWTTDDWASPSPDWDRCVKEGQTCALGNRLTLVRYGAYDTDLGEALNGPGKWWVGTLGPGNIPCNNQFLMGDPYPDRVKQCEVDRSLWRFCAPEGGTCQVPPLPQGRTAWWVRYGTVTSGDMYGYGSWMVGGVAASSSFSCTNGTFNRDPKPDFVKACWLEAK